MILSLFGPDGIGKSTIAQSLKDLGMNVLSGTDVASWPDKTWINELIAAGIHEPSYDNLDHFHEKIRRSHVLAKQLSASGSVVIDSDPLYKTLMHDYIRYKNTSDRHIFIRNRYSELSQLAKLEKYDNHKCIYLKLSDNIPIATQATLLQQRVRSRGLLAPFDSKNIETSLNMIEACKLIAQVIQENGNKVITINTDRPVSKLSLVSYLGYHD